MGVVAMQRSAGIRASNAGNGALRQALWDGSGVRIHLHGPLVVSLGDLFHVGMEPLREVLGLRSEGGVHIIPRF